MNYHVAMLRDMGLAAKKRVERDDIPADEHIGAGYLFRWYIQRLPQGNIYLHRFFAPDEGVPHDHPWDNLTVILEGSYIEHIRPVPSETEERVFRRHTGDVVVRDAETPHCIENNSIRKPVWTLFCTGPKRREWGFWTGDEWTHWRDYLGVSTEGYGEAEI